MATTTVSIGSNQSIDTETPGSSSGGGPLYTVVFGTTPSGISVGDIGFMDTEDAGGGNASDYTFLVTVINGSDITLKYLTDTGGEGDHSPLGLYTGGGSSGSGTQAPMVFKRAFSTITLFEAMIDDASPTHWGGSDDVVGECHGDADFTDTRVYFTTKQSLASVKLTANSADRHDGTASGTGGGKVLIRPTAGTTQNEGIIDINIDNFIMEWIEVDLGALDAQTTNKVVVIRGTNDGNIIRNNLIHGKVGNPGGSGPNIMHVVSAGATADVISILNNIIYEIIETSNDHCVAINTNQWGGISYIYNNTIYNIQANGGSKSAYGILFGNPTGAVANVKNNLVAYLVGAGTNERSYYKGSSGSTANTANNLSDDTANASYDAEDMAQGLNDSSSLIGKTLAEISFVSTGVGSEDLHIDTDSVCLEAGVDLGTTNEANIDIDGVDRDATGVIWDIGADQASVVESGAAAFMMFLD